MKITLFITIVALLSAHFSFAEILQVEPVSISAAHGMFISENDIWLADTFKKKDPLSQIYDLKGLPIPLVPKGVAMAGISQLPTADLFAFCDLLGSKVLLQDSHGEKQSTFSIPNPWNARWNLSGKKLYVVTYSGSVIQIDGSQKEILKNLDAPFDIAPVDENRFWISEQGAKGEGKVCLYDQNTEKEYEQIVCNKNVSLSNPEGLWPLSDGATLVVDTDMGRLLKVNLDGNTEILEEGLGLPILVQVLNEGKWVVYTNRFTSGPALIYGTFLQIKKY